MKITIDRDKKLNEKNKIIKKIVFIERPSTVLTVKIRIHQYLNAEHYFRAKRKNDVQR